MHLRTRRPPALTSWLELSRANWTLRERKGGKGEGVDGERGKGDRRGGWGEVEER